MSARAIGAPMRIRASPSRSSARLMPPTSSAELRTSAPRVRRTPPTRSSWPWLLTRRWAWS
eukprot:9134975-Alexandrium_andersonii.AAC.1